MRPTALRRVKKRHKGKVNVVRPEILTKKSRIRGVGIGRKDLLLTFGIISYETEARQHKVAINFLRQNNKQTKKMRRPGISDSTLHSGRVCDFGLCADSRPILRWWRENNTV
jgi:hypothetical protein